MTLKPQPLNAGDLIAIASPASAVKREYVDGARRRLEEAGFRVRVMPGAYGSEGSFSGTQEQRLDDMRQALTDPEVRAVLCSRGGYGCVHLLPALSKLDLRHDPKWLIGFSDVSALHALMASQGIVSIHGSMAKALAQHPIDFEPNKRLLHILTTGDNLPIETGSNPFNRPGTAEGTLLGGNLAVIQALIGTPFNVLRPDTILYIEDIAEPIYKVERILTQLRLGGVLDNIRGLIIGQFTEYSPDRNHPSMEEMIDRLLGDYHIPTAFGFPIGHIEDNLPLLNNSDARLEIGPNSVLLSQ